jgi:hypothetical protein
MRQFLAPCWRLLCSHHLSCFLRFVRSSGLARFAHAVPLVIFSFSDLRFFTLAPFSLQPEIILAFRVTADILFEKTKVTMKDGRLQTTREKIEGRGE